MLELGEVNQNKIYEMLLLTLCGRQQRNFMILVQKRIQNLSAKVSASVSKLAFHEFCCVVLLSDLPDE